MTSSATGAEAANAAADPYSSCTTMNLRSLIGEKWISSLLFIDLFMNELLNLSLYQPVIQDFSYADSNLIVILFNIYFWSM